MCEPWAQLEMKASPAAVHSPCMPAGVSQISIAAVLVFGECGGWECIKVGTHATEVTELLIRLGIEIRPGVWWAITVDYVELPCCGFVLTIGDLQSIPYGWLAGSVFKTAR